MAETERHVRLFRNGRNQALRIPFERVPSLRVENWLLE
jgi:virulence-associated protein VagC